MGLTEKMILLGVGMLIIVIIAVIMEAGSAYYSFLRGGPLTLDDERIILQETSHIEDTDPAGL